MRKTESKQIKDNPNPKANIGFMCYVPFNFYVYKNIYKHLPNSEFIVGDYYHVYPKEHVTHLIEFFSKQKNVYWRFIDKQRGKLTDNEFYSKYALIVSTWYQGDLIAPYNKDKKLVRLMYGNAKDLWNFGPWSAFFDLVLSYGDYSQKFLSIYGNSKIAGNPKFDDWFGNKLDKAKLTVIKKKLDFSKKTILYLPTYGDLSSLDLMVSALNQATEEYNILLKEHHLMHLAEINRILPYKANGEIIIIDDREDLLPYLKITDFVLSDNSGAIFDAVLADKPLILIDLLEDNFFNEYKETIYFKGNNRYSGVVTSKNSIEQRIKSPGEEIGSIIKFPLINEFNPTKRQIGYETLKNAMNNAEINEKIMSIRRNRIRDLVFSYNDGKCGNRAALEIKKLLYLPKPKPTFLAEAIDRYRNDFPLSPANKTKFYKEYAERLKDEYKYYLSIRALPFLKRVFVVWKDFFS